MSEVLQQLKEAVTKLASGRAALKQLETKRDEFQSRKDPDVVAAMTTEREAAIGKFVAGEIDEVTLANVKAECQKAVTEQDGLDEILAAIETRRSDLGQEMSLLDDRVKALRRQRQREIYEQATQKVRKGKAAQILQEIRAWSNRCGVPDQVLVNDLFGALDGDAINQIVRQHPDARELGL